MARLIGPAEKVLVFAPLVYSDRGPGDIDKYGDWLVVVVAVIDGPRRWVVDYASFLTWELPGLVRWSRQIADAAPDARDSYRPLEPDFQLDAVGRGDAARISAHFRSGLHPDWKAYKASGRTNGLDPYAPYTVEFEPGAAGLRHFADGLEAQLTRFPARFVERADSPQANSPMRPKGRLLPPTPAD